jgi:hypothetical protein
MSQLLKHSNIPLLANNNHLYHSLMHNYKYYPDQPADLLTAATKTTEKNDSFISTNSKASASPGLAKPARNIFKRMLSRQKSGCPASPSHSMLNSSATPPQQPTGTCLRNRLHLDVSNPTVSNNLDAQSFSLNYSNASGLDRLRRSSSELHPERSSSPTISINNEIDTISAILKTKNSQKNRQPLQQNMPPLTPESSDLSRWYGEPQDEAFKVMSEDIKSHFSPQTSTRIRVIDETDTDF